MVLLPARSERSTSMEQIVNVAKLTSAVTAVCAAMAIVSSAQTFTTLVSFSNGDTPIAALVQGFDGYFYGTTSGEVWGIGSVFKVSPSGTFTTLYTFCAQTNCADGQQPNAGLVQAANGDFYGTTYYGGVGGAGTIFEITTSGDLTPLYSFCAQTNCADGSNPNARLVHAANGHFYGTTTSGGANNAGTVFEMTPTGNLRTLYSFDSNYGATPQGWLIQGADANLYGTTWSGGANSAGTVFKITPNGTLTTLYSFCAQTKCADGANPSAGLVEAANGDFYGTTTYGGYDNCFHAPCGTVFRITPTGELTTLHRFSYENGTDGVEPNAGLLLASDGNFYGTTPAGGTSFDCQDGCGAVFKITHGGIVTVLHSFCVADLFCTDGYDPQAGLVQGTDGTFYGVAAAGGTDQRGTVYSLSVGLGAFVKTQPAYGKGGTLVTILGTNLTGTVSVTFNGVAAEFTVNSSGTAISTIVPSGATTGEVQVATPGGALLGQFHVIP